MRDDRERLLDILEAITRINRYAASGREAFEKNELIQNWVVSHIQIIGEASYSLSQSVKAKHPEVPWEQIVGMRHVLVHNYFEVDLEIVLNVVLNDLPVLRPKIEAILNEFQKPTEPAASTPPC